MMPAMTVRTFAAAREARWRPRHLGAVFIATGLAVVGLTGIDAKAQVTVPVQQVEAFENPPTNTHYAPINFSGSATGTDPTNFPGITFHAQANTTDTASSHAFFVG